MTVRVQDVRWTPSQWMGPEQLPLGTEASRLVIAPSAKDLGMVAVCARADFGPNDDGEGMAYDILPRDARRLAAELLLQAEAAEDAVQHAQGRSM